MNRDDLAKWARSEGWQEKDDFLVLTKPSKPHDVIVRMALKATVVTIEIKKPAGKWDKVVSESYAKIVADEETGFPRGLSLDTISGFSHLMEDNKNRAMFAKMGGKS
jgi:hypothetical protein